MADSKHATCFIAPLLSIGLIMGSGCRAFDEGLLDGGGGVDGGARCPLHKPPTRPTAADSASIDELYYAFKDVVLDQDDGVWTVTGYDLDDRCTTEPELDVECLAPATDAPREPDGFGGTDNALGHTVLPIILSVRPDFQPAANRGLALGLGSILLRVQDWNGRPDDPLVEATFMQTKFGAGEPFTDPIESVDLTDFVLRINGMEWPAPEWDGGDWFWARPDSFLGGDPSRPRVVDDNAYVANGTLVMRLPDRFPLVLAGQQTAFTLTPSDVVFTVELGSDHRTAHDAILAGRYPIADILTHIEDVGICSGSTDYQTLERLLSLAADIRQVPGSGGPGARCEAVSMALPFQTGIVANLGGVLEAYSDPKPCADGGVPSPDGGALDGGM